MYYNMTVERNDQNRFPVPKVQMDGCILDALVFAEWSSNIALTSKKEVGCDTTKATCGHASAEMGCPLVHVIFPPPLSLSVSGRNRRHC